MFAVFLNKRGNQSQGGVTWLDAEDSQVRIHIVNDTWIVDVGYENHPVVEVSWWGAKEYCSWAGYRLPTEAEWEKAARGTNAQIYPWGNAIPHTGLLNCRNEIGDTKEVGSCPEEASPYCALDMAGNVWGWVSSLYKDYPNNSEVGGEDNGSDSIRFRIYRGGSWSDGNRLIHVAYRYKNDSTYSNNTDGFRCTMDSE